MADPTTSDQVKDIVEVILGLNPVAQEDRLIEDLRAESVDLVNIVAALEDHFGIAIPEEAIAEVSTVADLVSLVQQQSR